MGHYAVSVQFDQASLFVAMLLILTSLCLALLAGLLSVQSWRSGWLYRRRQRRQLAHVNLSWMMTQLGLSVLSYLRLTSVADVDAHLAQCRTCGHRRRCDDFLQRATTDAPQCPNEVMIRKLLLLRPEIHPFWLVG